MLYEESYKKYWKLRYKDTRAAPFFSLHMISGTRSDEDVRDFSTIEK
jgi:hypothetical protein